MDIADILIHVHPELSSAQRTDVEQAVSGHEGVVSVHFSSGHPHELIVAYNPRAIRSEAILEQARQWDKEASMAGI